MLLLLGKREKAITLRVTETLWRLTGSLFIFRLNAISSDRVCIHDEKLQILK